MQKEKLTGLTNPQKTGLAISLFIVFLTWRVGGQQADSAGRDGTVSELLKGGRPTVAPG